MRKGVNKNDYGFRLEKQKMESPFIEKMKLVEKSLPLREYEFSLDRPDLKCLVDTGGDVKVQIWGNIGEV